MDGSLSSLAWSPRRGRGWGPSLPWHMPSCPRGWWSTSPRRRRWGDAVFTAGHTSPGPRRCDPQQVWRALMARRGSAHRLQVQPGEQPLPLHPRGLPVLLPAQAPDDLPRPEAHAEDAGEELRSRAPRPGESRGRAGRPPPPPPPHLALGWQQGITGGSPLLLPGGGVHTTPKRQSAHLPGGSTAASPASSGLPCLLSGPPEPDGCGDG